MAPVSTFQVCFLFLISFHFATAQTVVLDSSVGMRRACPGEVVTYTCTVNQGIALAWIVEPFISANDPIQFTSTTPVGNSFDCNDVAAVDCADFDFVATLTNTTNPMVVMSTVTLADMTSTLTFTATNNLNGTVVQCRGTTANATPTPNSTLNVADLPSPPRTPTSTVQRYGRDNVTLTVQWQPPQYDGGVPVSHNITVSSVGTFTTSGTSVPVTVPYNVNHTVSVVATNCNGSSSATMLSIRIANCSDPTAPRNGSIDPYQNTTEGAQIAFSCDQGLFPAGNMIAMCAANGSWTPNPSTTMCTSTGTGIHLPFLTIVLAVVGALVLAEEE